jgi:pimeloyl-ACP methyl ester carboxylesterase
MCYPMLPMQSMSRDLLGAGVRIRVTERGNSANPAVLLLHDIFFDSRTWDVVAEMLAREFFVITPDLPGFGNSEKPAPNRYPYGVDAFTEAIVDLYSGLGLARATVVGHGLGGAIAIALGARHPELVTRLVLLDAVCHGPPLGRLQRALALPFVGGFILKQLLGFATYRHFFCEYLVAAGTRIDASRVQSFFEPLSAPAARSSMLATLRATIDVRPVAADKARLATPTLVVWGRFDRLQPAAIGQHIAKSVRGAGFEVLNAGHSPQEECPEQLASVLRRFIRDERPSSY